MSFITQMESRVECKKRSCKNMEDTYKSEAVNILEENVDKCFHDLGVEKDFKYDTKRNKRKDFKILTL